MMGILEEAHFTARTPEGAYYVMADFAGLAWDRARHARPEWSLDRTFAEYMAREVGVAVVPGSSFYYQGGGETRVRFNFAKTQDTLHEAARRLGRLR
jgi:aminotransferase